MPTSPPNREAYWRAVRRWTLGLLLVWAGVTFGVVYQAATGRLDEAHDVDELD